MKKIVKQKYIFLKSIYERQDRNQDICLHEIAHKLKVYEELEINNYTIIQGNNNFLDLIKNVDLTEFCIMYCPFCHKLQHITTEGCAGVLLLICDECNQIVIEIFPKEEKLISENLSTHM